MALLTSTLSVKLIDGVTGPAKGVAKALGGIKAASIGINNTPVNALARLDKAIATNQASLDATRGRLIDAAAGFIFLKKAIGAPIQAAREFQSAMADVKKVVDFGSPEELKRFEKGILDLSTRIPVAATKLTEIAAAAGQAGLAKMDILPFTENVAYVATAFKISEEAAGTALARMKTALGMTIPETVLLADHMNTLANNMATSELEVLDITARVGALAQSNSIAAKEVAALGAAMTASGVKSEIASTAIRNMIIELASGANASKSTQDALSALGYNAETVAKRLQTEGMGLVVEVLEKIQKQAPHTRAAITTGLFGKRAVDAVVPLIGNMSTLHQALGLIEDDAKNAGAAVEEFRKRNETSAAATQLFSNRVNLLAVNIGKTLLPEIDRGAGLLGKLALGMANVVAKFPGLTKAVIIGTAAIIGLRVATIGLGYGFLLAKGGALQVARSLVVLQGAALATAGRINLLRAAFAAGFGKLVLINTIAPAVAVLKGLGAALAVVGGALAAVTAPVWFMGAALVATGLLIYKFWKPISGFLVGFFRGLGKALAPLAPLLAPVRMAFNAVGSAMSWVGGLIGDLVGWLGGLLKPVDDVNGAWESFGENLGTRFGESIMRAISWLRRLLSPLDLAVSGMLKLGSAFGFFGGGGDAPGAPGGPAPSPRVGGGAVSPGRSYLVGEKRPEIFTPSRAGTILPKASAPDGRGLASFTVNFTFSGVESSNPAEIERRVRNAMRDEVKDLFRGAYADLGAT